MDDAYLDGPVFDERRAAWRERFSGAEEFVLFIAERGDKPCGFISWFPDADAEWGGLIDNFHMAPDEKGRGLGRRLFDEVSRLAASERPGQGLWLTVLAGNVAAQRAYDRLGGRQAGRFDKVSGDGGAHPVIRYVWPAPAIGRADRSGAGEIEGVRP
jgi:ribosomal protein S18 acetylase RimI-like enzyme